MTFVRWAVVVILLLSAGPGFGRTSPLVIAAEDAAGPWSKKDGTGYANDVVREAFRAVGVEVEFKVVPYARCKHMVVGGDVVACFSMSPEAGLQKSVVLSDMPLFMVKYDYYQNLRKPLKAKREKDIPPGTIVGIVIDYEYPRSTMDLEKKGVVFETSRDEETNLKKLALGRIDAAIIDHNEIKPVHAMLEMAGAAGSVSFAFRSGRMGSYIGFSRKHPQGESARNMFNRGYRIIRENGTLERINAKWIAAAQSKAER
jgi:polar amino acid transport system substrate-binding protein